MDMLLDRLVEAAFVVQRQPGRDGALLAFHEQRIFLALIFHNLEEDRPSGVRDRSRALSEGATQDRGSLFAARNAAPPVFGQRAGERPGCEILSREVTQERAGHRAFPT
jgi:hypothetical protein